MNAHGLRHLVHGKRVKGGWALGEVVGLAEGDDLEKFLQSFLAAFERMEKKAGGTNPFFEVRAGLFICRAVTEQIFIGVADTESGKKISLDVRNPAISVSDEGGFGADDEVGAIRGDSGARAWGEAGNGLGG